MILVAEKGGVTRRISPHVIRSPLERVHHRRCRYFAQDSCLPRKSKLKKELNVAASIPTMAERLSKDGGVLMQPGSDARKAPMQGKHGEHKRVIPSIIGTKELA